MLLRHSFPRNLAASHTTHDLRNAKELQKKTDAAAARTTATVPCASDVDAAPEGLDVVGAGAAVHAAVGADAFTVDETAVAV